MFHKHQWDLRARIASKPYSGPSIQAEGITSADVLYLIQGQVTLVFTCSCGEILEKKYPGSEVKLEEEGNDG